MTILVPNYKTLALTKLCLRLIRKYTNLKQAHVIVIDNDSADESLDYLKSLSWIELIERHAQSQETPPEAHARALDLALERVTTPYVLSIHTDTLVKNEAWLPFLLAQFKNDHRIAGVGSWKLENKPMWRNCLKRVEYHLQWMIYKMIGKTHHALAGVGKENYYYLRSHCAIYRMEVIKQLRLRFGEGDMVAGKYMHKRMLDAGYNMIFLPSEVLSQYVIHLNHATSLLNPELSSRPGKIDKGLRRINKILQQMSVQAILQDDGLDVGG